MWPLSRWERGTRVCDKEPRNRVSLAGKRASEEANRMKKEGGTGGRKIEGKRKKYATRPTESEAIFALLFCQAENERGSDRLTAPILFTGVALSFLPRYLLSIFPRHARQSAHLRLSLSFSSYLFITKNTTRQDIVSSTDIFLRLARNIRPAINGHTEVRMSLVSYEEIVRTSCLYGLPLSFTDTKFRLIPRRRESYA